MLTCKLSDSLFEFLQNLMMLCTEKEQVLKTETVDISNKWLKIQINQTFSNKFFLLQNFMRDSS